MSNYDEEGNIICLAFKVSCLNLIFLNSKFIQSLLQNISVEYFKSVLTFVSCDMTFHPFIFLSYNIISNHIHTSIVLQKFKRKVNYSIKIYTIYALILWSKDYFLSILYCRSLAGVNWWIRWICKTIDWTQKYHCMRRGTGVLGLVVPSFFVRRNLLGGV